MPNNLFKKINSDEHGGQININKNIINNNNLNRIKIDLRSNNEILEDDEQKEFKKVMQNLFRRIVEKIKD